MLSDRDLRALSIPHTANQEWLGEFFRETLDAKVAGIMSGNVITIDEETETTTVIELMLEHKVGALPVLNAEGALVGIVSYIDVLRELYELSANSTR
jgi:CBS domain-containing membrane protein